MPESADPRIVLTETLSEGDLLSPPNARGVVLIPHGNGMKRGRGDSFVARKLYQAGLAAMLVDLLTPEEQDLDARIACFRFDIELLANRLTAAASWLADDPSLRGLPVGYFAGGNAAAAAFSSAVQSGRIAAIVSYSGRPDLAESQLSRVTTPTLLVVDGGDESLISLNRDRLADLGAEQKHYVLVPSTAAPFEDPSPPEEVARLATAWFLEHFQRPAGASPQRRSGAWPAKTQPAGGTRTAEQGA
jgi:putative phosphoribosyl transferase